MGRQIEFRKIINACGFVALTLIAISLLLQKMNVFLEILKIVSEITSILAYIITGLCGYLFAVTQRKVWIWVTFAVSATIIAVFVVVKIAGMVA